MNILDAFVNAAIDQFETSWLNAVHPLNIEVIEFTNRVLVKTTGELNEVQLRNAVAIVVAAFVFNPVKSWLNNDENAKQDNQLVTKEVSQNVIFGIVTNVVHALNPFVKVVVPCSFRISVAVIVRFEHPKK